MEETTQLVDPSSFGGGLNPQLEPPAPLPPLLASLFAPRKATGPRAFGQQMPTKLRENTKRKKRAIEKASRKRNRG